MATANYLVMHISGGNIQIAETLNATDYQDALRLAYQRRGIYKAENGSGAIKVMRNDQHGNFRV